jgi:hypothetical protein
MIFEDVTIQDCHREAWLESQITLAQRKINRLCKEISFKEEIAQRLMSPWFCEHYDNQIGRRYEEMAQLEGAVRAAQLELDRLADKRYADKARRLAAIALIEEVGKKATAGTTPASAPPQSDPRQKQQDMFFGPGAPPAASPQSTAPTLDEKAENDIARAFEMCAREIPPPDPTPAASTPAASTSAVPLTRPTLSRVLTATGSEGQAEMAMGDAAPADDGEEESAPADAPATETASETASETADAKDSANDPTTQAGTAPRDGARSEQAEGDGPSGMN